MDPKLAEVYKTNQALETEAEALATASMAEKLAAAEDLDVTGLSDEEAEALASQLIGDPPSEEGEANAAAEDDEAPAEEEEPAAEEPAEEEEKVASDEAQEKIAEADYLGRVMAHAFVQERSKIAAAQAEKTAAKKDPKDGKVMGHLKKASVKLKKASEEAPAAEEAKDEQVSALDRLALARAQEILKENGIEEQEKKSSIDEEKAALLAAKVEERAQAMLKDAGYEFEEQK